jgi:A/G-specific adenine glycosylase
VPVYGLLIEKYPTLKALISAKKTELYDILRPLGLRWRIEFLHRMVKELEAKFEGKIPRDKNSLLSLSGVSDYIAGAVRCFAWNLPESLIDTNTVRIIGRVFGLKIKDSSRRNAQFKYLSSALLDSDDSRAFNYAMLDLANSICTKTKAPDCKQCPIMNWCAYGSAQKKIM